MLTNVQVPPYRIIPCRHGVCVSRSPTSTRKIRATGSTKDVTDIVLLPGNLSSDDSSLNTSIIFSPLVTLDEQDLQNLNCCAPENFSFTYYGPEGQEKPTNQDFALSGHFFERQGNSAKFCILADGISNGFSFPHRGAQLSCFAAYNCLKKLHAKLEETPQKLLSESNVKEFQNNLAQEINRFLQIDYKHLLLYYETEHLEPPDIESTVWEKHFKFQPEKWYGNTLIVSYLSSHGGIIVYVGDGRIIVLKDNQPPNDILYTNESSVINGFVGFNVSKNIFQGALVSYETNNIFIEIIMATDGLDRTYHRNKLNFVDAFSKDSNLSDIVKEILNLDKRYSHIDIDNYSIGRIFFPLSGNLPHNRLINPGTPPLTSLGTPTALPPKESQQTNKQEDAKVGPTEQPKETPNSSNKPELLYLFIALGLFLLALYLY